MRHLLDLRRVMVHFRHGDQGAFRRPKPAIASTGIIPYRGISLRNNL
jgi:hypothetical protein